MKAATVDDVQPAAVYAAEAIGSQLVVDPHLIGKAVDALGGHQSYRIQSIKLQLGLSSGGIPSQMRLSVPATQTFCLVTALRLHLPASEIGNLLYEFLVESRAIETTPVSASQLASLVDSIEGHCVMMQEQQAIAKAAISPIVEALASSAGTIRHTHLIFLSMVPDESAKLLIAVFRAIRDQEVRRLKITGSRAAIWLAGLLYWLCPKDVEVIDADNRQLVSALSPSPKVSVVFDNSQEVWSLEHWYGLESITSLIQVEENQFYDREEFPLIVPTVLFCALNMESASKNKTIASLCCGLIQTAFYKGIITKDLDEPQPSQLIPFREICTKDFSERVDQILKDYGWSLTTDNYQCADLVSQYISSNPFDFLSQERVTYIRQLDESIGGRLLEGLLEEILKSDDELDILIMTAMSVTQGILLRATHRSTTEGDWKASRNFRTFPILAPLISEGKALLASTFFRASLTNHYYAFSVREGTANPDRMLAVSDRGYVSYYRGLVALPQSPAEAFEITTIPGTLKFRDVRHRSLYESTDFPTFSSPPSLGVYQVSGSLDTLRIYHNKGPQFAIQKRYLETAIQLHCSEPSTGDRVAKLSSALINWALARRVERTGHSKEDLLRQCRSLSVTQLSLKAPGWDGIGCHPDFPTKIRAIASYGYDELANFLRFGTFDVDGLKCLIQGPASVYECICLAAKEYGDGWIIMGTP
ncbi:hypothetical protein MMC10_003446 [Thelotrema lepadinum]|nr:hypothetical protein [Thelotrema lepadinum]